MAIQLGKTIECNTTYQPKLFQLYKRFIMNGRLKSVRPNFKKIFH